jgi:hypothetical protein
MLGSVAKISQKYLKFKNKQTYAFTTYFQVTQKILLIKLISSVTPDVPI